MWAIAINYLYFALTVLVVALILRFKGSKKTVLVFIAGCGALAYCSFMVTSGYLTFMLALFTAAAIFMPFVSFMFKDADEDEKCGGNGNCWAVAVLVFVLIWNFSSVMFYKYEELDDTITYTNQENRKKEEVFIQSLPYKTGASKHLPYLLSIVGGSACLYDLNSFRCDMLRKLLIDKYEYEVERDECSRIKKRAEALEKQEKVEREVAEFKNRTK